MPLLTIQNELLIKYEARGLPYMVYLVEWTHFQAHSQDKKGEARKEILSGTKIKVLSVLANPGEETITAKKYRHTVKDSAISSREDEQLQFF